LRPGRSTLCREFDSRDGKITIFQRRRLRGNPVTPAEKAPNPPVRAGDAPKLTKFTRTSCRTREPDRLRTRMAHAD
jgi:hypothetical protein